MHYIFQGSSLVLLELSPYISNLCSMVKLSTRATLGMHIESDNKIADEFSSVLGGTKPMLEGMPPADTINIPASWSEVCYLYY